MSNVTKVAATALMATEQINVKSIDTTTMYLGDFKINDDNVEYAIALHCKSTVLKKFGLKLKISGKTVTNLKVVNDKADIVIGLKLRKPEADETLLDYWNDVRLSIVGQYRVMLGSITQIPLVGFKDIVTSIDIEEGDTEAE